MTQNSTHCMAAETCWTAVADNKEYGGEWEDQSLAYT